MKLALLGVRTVCFLGRHGRMTAKLSSYVLLFPGQGSQIVGMTNKQQHFPSTQSIFYKAQEVLGYDLQTLCLRGPQERLDNTVHCQPAVVVASLVALGQLEQESPQVLSNCVAAAGFSVGEITALIFAGSLSLEQGLQLIKARAESMQCACEEIPSGMLTILGLEPDSVQSLCDKANATIEPSPRLCIANRMFPRGFVVSGGYEGIKRVEEWAVTEGGVTKHVPVSGAFHSTFMNSAVPKLKRLLQTLDISMPRFSVISNVTARPYSSVEEIRQLLAEQVIQPVLWEESMRRMLEQSLTFVEVGPGRQLKTMLRSIDRNTFRTCISVTV